MDCSPLGSSVHGILQARILERAAIPFSRGIFPTQGIEPASHVSCVGRLVPCHRRLLGSLWRVSMRCEEGGVGEARRHASCARPCRCHRPQPAGALPGRPPVLKPPVLPPQEPLFSPHPRLLRLSLSTSQASPCPNNQTPRTWSTSSLRLQLPPQEAGPSLLAPPWLARPDKLPPLESRLLLGVSPPPLSIGIPWTCGVINTALREPENLHFCSQVTLLPCGNPTLRTNTGWTP